VRNIKLTIAYDGATFHGWQIQPGVPTIQGAIVEAASKITQERVFLFGASRTDAGVHALGQVAHFKTQSALLPVEFRRALNALLPPSIRVVACEEVGRDFHSRWQAQAKTYCYRIFRAPVLPPFEHLRALHYPWPLDLAAMREAARLFEGEHDFTSFAASSGSEEDDADRDAHRLIYRSEILERSAHPFADVGLSGPNHPPGAGQGSAEESSAEIVFLVRGKSFLRYMVRKMVGTLLDAGKGKLTPADILRLLELSDRSKSGPTAPPEGLYLVSLEYPDPLAGLLGGLPASR
jgi:tRNA pseudouridine38-40 synthase